MKILEVRALRGPNVYHNQPVLIMKLDLEDRAEMASTDMPGFTERLTALLPGLWEHRCSPGYRGGFIERLNRGTYLGHIIEHIALELSTPAGIEVGFGKTVHAGAPGVYNVVVRYKNEAGMEHLLREAVRVAESVINEEACDIDAIVEEAKRLAEDTALGPSSRAIVEAAEKRSIPWRRIGGGSLVQLGYGKNRRRVQTAVTDQTSLIATEIAQDKQVTKQVLSEVGIPVAEGFSARSEAEVKTNLRKYSAPYVVKPIDGHHGDGVTLGLQTEEAVLAACLEAWKYSKEVLIEEEKKGRDYRLLVVGGKLTAIAERTPAHVIGDGVHMIEELVEIANRDPRRGDGHSNVMTRIEIDEQTEKYLSEQGLHLHVVPSRGHRVFLKRTANLSTGGTAKDVTEIAHDSIRDVAERVARVIGLDICGIDLIHDDISRPLNAQSAVIEVNAGPGLRMHVAPSEGRARDVGGAIVDMLYPPGTEARIPIASVTGTNGKTTVSRLVAHVASLSGAIVGLTCSDGIFINGRCVERGDTTGPRSARLVLSDPAIEIAVLETARGGLLRNGLGYDWSEVGVITNIRPDHIGQDGIEDLTDLIRVKSIVAERVRVGGSVILNADDPEASRVLETRNIDHKDRNVIYYSLRADHPLLRESLRHGGRAYCVKDGWICEMADADIIQIAPVSELKFTFGGTASFHISNALAAAAASRALGISREHLARGLTTFRANFHNTGRANIYRVGRGYALLDYGHNPDALEAVGAMIRSWNPKSATAVIGLPGDRNDSLLRDCTRAVAKHFDRLILRDDHDLRGREPGEVPDLMEKVLQEEAPQVERRILLAEHSAIQAALSNLGEGELAVIFYDDFDMAASSLRTFDPIPVDEIEFVHEKVQANLESFESLEMPQASAESTNVHQLSAQRS